MPPPSVWKGRRPWNCAGPGLRCLLLLLVLSGCATSTPQGSVIADGSAENEPGMPLADSDLQTAEEASDQPYGGLRLGPGDLIRMTMYGFPEMETSAHVGDDGRVRLPLIGPVDVQGLSPGAAEDRIAEAYREARYFRRPQPNITIGEFRSGQISVLGHVQRPGRFPLDTELSVLDAIALAEGVRETGAWFATLIRPQAGGPLSTQISLRHGKGAKALEATQTLRPGDIVYVPEVSYFYIDGEVNRPDRYPLRPGLTVQQAISQGGGITPRGSYSRVLIKRESDRGRLESIRTSVSDPVRADDVIIVRGSFF